VANRITVKQIDREEEESDYRDELSALIEQAIDGELEQDEFEDRVVEITVALILLFFLLGSKRSFSDISSDYEMQRIIADNERIARESARRLGNDIYVLGRYTATDERPEDAIEQAIDSRATTWANTLAGIFALGQLFRSDNPFLEWQVGPTEHCEDCARLNGQIHTAEEWRMSGWTPQARHLECHGYNCQCSLVESQGPARGNF
jgi:hypothetical protein